MKRGVAPHKKNSKKSNNTNKQEKNTHLPKKTFSLFLIFISDSLTLTLNSTFASPVDGCYIRNPNLAQGLWKPDINSMWQPVWFSKIYMYKSKPIFTTNSYSCESLRSVLTPIFTCKSANQFLLWEPSQKPSEHSRTAPNTGPADHAKDVQHLYESQAPGHHTVGG